MMPLSSPLDTADAQRFLLFLEVLPLLVLLICAAMIDLRCRRIPNWLTFTILAAGLTRAGFAGGLPEGMVGVTVGFLLILPLYLLGAIGAGDVKLMAAVGAWFLARGVFEIFLLTAVVSLVLVVSQVSCSGRLRQLLQNTGVLVASVWAARRIGVGQVVVIARTYTSINRPLPYAIPIAAAVMFAVSGIRLF